MSHPKRHHSSTSRTRCIGSRRISPSRSACPAMPSTRSCRSPSKFIGCRSSTPSCWCVARRQMSLRTSVQMQSLLRSARMSSGFN
eukprot:scaffold72904_cov38-Tisochrysis_lutea.AAC.3